MKRLVLILLIGSVVALLSFVLLPGPMNPADPSSRALAADTPTSATPSADSAISPSDSEVHRLEAARRDAEERAEVLQRKLAEAEAAKAIRKKAKRPFADPDMRKVMTAEAASSAERSAAVLVDAGLAADLQLNEAQRGAL